MRSGSILIISSNNLITLNGAKYNYDSKIEFVDEDIHVFDKYLRCCENNRITKNQTCV